MTASLDIATDWLRYYGNRRLRQLSRGAVLPRPDDPNTVEEAIADPEAFADKTIGQVADHYVERHRPAQQQAGRHRPLVRRPARRRSSPAAGLAAATVAIDPAPFRGVLPLPLLGAARRPRRCCGNPANRHRAVPLTYEQFRYAFANAVDEDQARRLFDTFAVPAPGAPLWQAAAANFNPRDRGQGRHAQPRPGAAADRVGREGPHRPAHVVPRGLRRASRRTRASRSSPRSRAAGHALTIDDGSRGQGHGPDLHPPVRVALSPAGPASVEAVPAGVPGRPATVLCRVCRGAGGGTSVSRCPGHRGTSATGTE